MNWLWIILGIGVVGAIIGYIASGGKIEEAATTGCAASWGCGTVIFQIFLGVLSIGLMIALFGWLFGGCN